MNESTFRTQVARFRRRVSPAAWSRASYSQEAEDLLIAEYFADKADGFYVDIGCHHPYRFSNTYLLYRKGWSGLGVDPLPGVKDAFARARPRDKVIEVGVSEEARELAYHMFDEPALNTFDAETAQAHQRNLGASLLATKSIPSLPLHTLFAENGVATIDLMSVDVEGFDLQALRSNDWQRWRPRVIIAESLGATLAAVADDPVCLYLASQGYVPAQKTVRNIIYLREERG